MNNIKRIIAAGLVGTAVISTGVMASAQTYDENLQETMNNYKVPSAMQEKLKAFAAKHVIKDSYDKDGNKVAAAQTAKKANDAINKCIALYHANGDSAKALKASKDFTEVQYQQGIIEDALGVKIALNNDNSISVLSNGVAELSFTKTELGDAKTAMGGDVDSFAKAVPSLLTYMQVPTAQRGETMPGTDNPGTNPGTGTPTTGPSTDVGGHEQERNDVIDGLSKIKSDDAKVNDAKDKILKILNDRGCNYDDYLAAKALVDALPAGPEKDALLKALSYIQKYYQFGDGTTIAQKEAEATNTPAANDATNNGGTTAKTATNFGNVALAGAGLMTVAGAVFVISKKKIC